MYNENYSIIFSSMTGNTRKLADKIHEILPKESFNLDKEQQRRAWEYLQTMNRQDFKSYSQVISIALVDYFDRYYRTQADLYLETREREELFVKQIVDAVEYSLKQSLPLFLSGLTAGMVQREPKIRASFPAPENSQPDSDVDWDFLGE